MGRTLGAACVQFAMDLRLQRLNLTPVYTPWAVLHVCASASQTTKILKTLSGGSMPPEQASQRDAYLMRLSPGLSRSTLRDRGNELPENHPRHSPQTYTVCTWRIATFAFVRGSQQNSIGVLRDLYSSYIPAMPIIPVASRILATSLALKKFFCVRKKSSNTR